MIETITNYGQTTFGGAWPTLWALTRIVAVVVPLLLLVAYLTLWERKAIGWTQIRPGPNRVGPLGLLQPIADAVKLIFKEIIVPTAANRGLFFLGPVMPITWITSLVGSLALIGTPFFSGFYSKDSIIEAVHASHLPGAGFAYFAVAAGVFVTAFYSFRMYFLVFHGPERFRDKPFPPEEHHDVAGHDESEGHGAAAHATHGAGAARRPQGPGSMTRRLAAVEHQVA